MLHFELIHVYFLKYRKTRQNAKFEFFYSKIFTHLFCSFSLFSLPCFPVFTSCRSVVVHLTYSASATRLTRLPTLETRSGPPPVATPSSRGGPSSVTPSSRGGPSVARRLSTSAARLRLRRSCSQTRSAGPGPRHPTSSSSRISRFRRTTLGWLVSQR